MYPRARNGESNLGTGRSRQNSRVVKVEGTAGLAGLIRSHDWATEDDQIGWHTTECPHALLHVYESLTFRNL